MVNAGSRHWKKMNHVFIRGPIKRHHFQLGHLENLCHLHHTTTWKCKCLSCFSWSHLISKLPYPSSLKGFLTPYCNLFQFRINRFNMLCFIDDLAHTVSTLPPKILQHSCFVLGHWDQISSPRPMQCVTGDIILREQYISAHCQGDSSLNCLLQG